MIKKKRSYIRFDLPGGHYYRAIVSSPIRYGYALLKKWCGTATEAEKYGQDFIRKWLPLHSQNNSNSDI